MKHRAVEAAQYQSRRAGLAMKSGLGTCLRAIVSGRRHVGQVKSDVSTFTLRSGRLASFARVRSWLLPGHFVLTFPVEPSAAEAEELFGLGLECGRARSLVLAGVPDSFTLIHGGHATRRVAGWHLHVVVVRNRAEKAWPYLVLGGKNLLQATGLRRDPQRSHSAEGRYDRPGGTTGADE